MEIRHTTRGLASVGPQHSSSRECGSVSGFTLVEMLVVITIMGILVMVTAVGFQNMGRASALKIATEEVQSALSGARTRTLASEGDTVYGVHMSTSSVTRFSGSTYISGAPANETYSFERGVTATSSLIASGIDIVFSRLTGAASASGTVTLVADNGSASTTIHINASGLIEY